jgi:pimeloyl-ACP methyl ester carboxylesterase
MVTTMSSQTLILPNGRQLGYAVEGEGKPVIYFHGTASSRLEIVLLKQFTQTNHFQIIGIDRPGYGLSTFTARNRLRDFAADVNALADHLGLDRFFVLSWSGGGPFALTYTALNPSRVTHAVIVGSPALPFDPSTAHNNNPLAKYAMKASFLAKWALGMFRKSVLSANQDIESYLKSRSGKSMVADWPQPDARFFADPKWLKLMYGAMAEGFRQSKSVDAIYQEHRLFMKPWNEPIAQIPEGKVTLWQGNQDKTCPVSNAYKIAKTIQSATKVEVFSNEGHCVMFAKPEKLSKTLNQNP